MRRLAFWGAVAGVSILANFALELVTHQTGAAGLAEFTAFAHKGA